MNQDLSILQLVLHASIGVQLVMALLLLVSITSWAAIFRKLFALRRVKSLNESFEREFWSGTSLNDLFANATKSAKPLGPMERIFGSGMREFQKLRERRITDVATLMDGARRAMRASFQREMDEIESHLSFLASVGSVSPYIGLFGTVWGIMNSFIGISRTQTTNLAVVAPGIAEALLATAIGLVAAIPAVIFYNHLTRVIGGHRALVGEAAEEILRIVSRDLDRASARQTRFMENVHGRQA